MKPVLIITRITFGLAQARVKRPLPPQGGHELLEAAVEEGDVVKRLPRDGPRLPARLTEDYDARVGR